MDNIKSKAITSKFFEEIQEQFCSALERVEEQYLDNNSNLAKFEVDEWTKRDGNGGGKGSILYGNVFEKAGVNTSTTWGVLSPEMRTQVQGAENDGKYWASGISLIVHPSNPHVPAVHMNIRHIITTKAWFGGGADLTPMLPTRRNEDDSTVMKFHQSLKDVCLKTKANYQKYKQMCDEYFVLKHQDNLMRGVGGIFFDHLSTDEESNNYDFIRKFGETFTDLYLELVYENIERIYNSDDRKQQLKMRGLYVEFNLLYDRGTKFGLASGGNTKTILSSLPPLVSW